MSWWNPSWSDTKETWAPAFKNIEKFGIGVATRPFKDIYSTAGWAWNKPIEFPKATQSLSETFSVEGYRKGGEFIRGVALSRIGGFGKGMIYGSPKPNGGESGWDKFKNILDTINETGQAAKDRVEDPFGGWSFQDWLNEQTAKIPKPSDIIPEEGLIQVPDIDLTPVKEGMDDFAMALAMGLAALGQGIGGGIPQMPSMQLVGEEGEPNILMLGGLAAVAYIVLKGRGK